MSPLHVRKEGQGPVVVLSHALGADLSMWDAVAALLRDDHTVVRYDHPGHGRSPARASPFTIDDLADDAATVIADLEAGPVHFVGLSMGGMTAQALAARQPDRVASLVVANSAQFYDDEAKAMWQTRIDTVRAHGMAAIADGALARWFTPAFLQDPARGQAAVARARSVLEATAPGAYAEACAAVAGIDLAAGNAQIRRPTLVIAGQRDEATPPALSEAIASSIGGAKLRSLDAAHLSAIEQPEAFVHLLREFWAGIGR